MSKFLVIFAILAACAVYVCTYPSAEASASAKVAAISAETDLTDSAADVTAGGNGDSDLKGSETFGFGYYPRYYPVYYGGYGGGYGGWGGYGWNYHHRPIYPVWG